MDVRELSDVIYGVGAYERRWRSMPWYTRFYWTIRGWNPGGRKGAPPLRQEA